MAHDTLFVGLDVHKASIRATFTQLRPKVCKRPKAVVRLSTEKDRRRDKCQRVHFTPSLRPAGQCPNVAETTQQGRLRGDLYVTWPHEGE